MKIICKRSFEQLALGLSEKCIVEWSGCNVLDYVWFVFQIILQVLYQFH